MTSYSVDAVSPQVKDVKLQHGDFKSYKLTLSTPDGQVDAEWLRRATSPAPSVGQVIEGTLEDGPYGRKFKATPSGGGHNREEDPKKAAAIQRMWALNKALDLTRLRLELALGAKPETPEEFLETLRKTADWLDKDVQRARDAA